MYTIDTKTYYSTFGHGGRFGNYFFRNMLGSILAEKYDLKAQYKYHEIFDKLHIDLYSGTKNYNSPIIINNSNYLNYLENNIEITNNLLLFDYFQVPEFCKYLQKYFDKKYRDKFNINNPYYHNINNNDLFVHVRLDDIANFTPGFEYYDNIISSIKYNIGYISSDSPTHPIVLDLIKKHNLLFFNGNEIDFLLYGSTFKNIILSNGSFSWVLGFLSNNSNIYYPIMTEKWYGDIYVFDKWNGIFVK
jgi:hypothetical protein